MSAAALLEQLEHRGVRLSAVGGKLRCRAPKGLLSRDDLSELAEHKAELLLLLEQVPPSPEAVLQAQLDAGWVGHLASRETAEGHLEAIRAGREEAHVDANGRVWVRAASSTMLAKRQHAAGSVTARDYLPRHDGETTASYVARFQAAMPTRDLPPVSVETLSAAEFVQHLRQSGYRVSLREDRFSIDFTPGLLKMSMPVFNAVIEQVDEIRECLRSELKKRTQ